MAVFGSSNRLYRPEEALRHVRNSEPIVALTSDSGVVFASVRNNTSQLRANDPSDSVHKIDSHLGCVTTGIEIDALSVVDELQVIAQSERLEYGTPIPPETLAKQIGQTILRHIEFEADRPHGMVSLIGGVHNEQPTLHEVLPHGQTRQHLAVAVGRQRETIMGVFENRYESDMSIEQLRELAIDGLSTVYDLSDDRVSVSMSEVPVGSETYRDVDNIPYSDN